MKMLRFHNVPFPHVFSSSLPQSFQPKRVQLDRWETLHLGKISTKNAVSEVAKVVFSRHNTLWNHYEGQSIRHMSDAMIKNHGGVKISSVEFMKSQD